MNTLSPGDDPIHVKAAAFAPSQATARRSMCDALALALDQVGRRSVAAGHAWGIENLQGLGVMTRFAAELSAAALHCLGNQHCYASAALVRQIVEVEYFMWLFSTDPDAGQRWLNASSDDMRKTFSPSNLRKMSGGVFDNVDYWKHCDMAGHPSPAARVLLNQDADESLVTELAYADLAQHLDRIWRFLDEGLAIRGAQSPLVADEADRVENAIRAWRETDRLASPLRTQVEVEDDT